MTTAILVSGICLAFALAIVMIRREWRLPALAFGLLAIPGNVDDLLPQMHLDPHQIVGSTAAAVSVVALLLAWSVILTAREGRSQRIPPWIFALAGTLATLATLSAAVATVRGVEPLAAVRGAVVFVQVAAVLFLAGNLIASRQDAYRLALAFAGGGVILIGNGLYTSTTQNLARFTATTFGRNTFAVALIVCTVVAGGLVFSLWDRLRASGRYALLIVGATVVAGAALFGAVASGSRISMVALVGAAGLVLALNAGWRSAAGLRRVTVVAVVMIAIIGSAGVLTSGGGRTISVVTSVGDAAQGVSDPGSLPVYSEIRSRVDFWHMALQMIARNPVFGVGPFQWNFERYKLAKYEPLVADPHNSYLQVAAEYGIPTAALYLLLLAACFAVVVSASRRPMAIARSDWTVASLAGGAFAFALADATNSNLFNERMGLVGWLLVAAAVSCAAVSLRETVTAETATGRARAPATPSRREAA